jgi:hypothetical protein
MTSAFRNNRYRLFKLAILAFFATILFSCEKVMDRDDKLGSNEYVFDELWNTIRERYALFSVKTVDWGDVYQRYRPRVKNSITADELFRICSDMLEELQDGHITLQSGAKTFTYENFFRLFPVNFNYNNVKKYYLKDQFKTSGPFVYKVEQGVGYLYYSSFADDYTNNELQEVFKELNTSRGIILDIRSNTGGKSFNVNRLVERFIDVRRLVKYELIKKGPGPNEFDTPKPFYLVPSGNRYDKQVVVLTNRTCFSACNDFALYMSLLPQVSIVGDQTGGGGSVPANYLLSNGWLLQYSATMTLSPAMQSIERGVLPDYKVNISPIDESNGLDPIIEKAFSLIR